MLKLEWVRMKGFPFLALFFSVTILFGSSFASDSITSGRFLRDNETLESSDGRFQLGFFSLGASKNRYLGIWYTITPTVYVWVANRETPISDSYGVLSIFDNGTFVLLNGTRGIVWNSSVSEAVKNPVLKLLDSGNLVLMSKDGPPSKRYAWQSFDFPADTRIPGMKMGRDPTNNNKNLYISSWRRADDPSPGITYMMLNPGQPHAESILANGSEKIFRTGPWNGRRYSGFPTFNASSLSPGLSLDQNGNLYGEYDVATTSVFTRLTVNYSGNLQRYLINGNNTKWSLVYELPVDPCDKYGHCGPNGICSIYKSPICECLNGFVPKSKAWEEFDWSDGCIRRTPLVCNSGEDFVKIAGVKLPDLLDFWLNTSMSLQECRQKCLNDCSCTAHANIRVDKGGSGCYMWFGPLVDVREFSDEDGGQEIYVRLAAPDLDGKVTILGSSKKKRPLVILVPTVLAGILILCFVLVILWKRIAKRRVEDDLELPLFDLNTIAAATDNFSVTNMLGEGGFGMVYKGNLGTDQEIAVKRLSKDSGQGLEEFKTEVLLIAKLQHRNLVRLLGCCIQREERILIYEYMPKKSLDNIIFDTTCGGLLSWEKRFNIIMGIARGLVYLHHDSRLRIIHRDLKASNILLDSNLNPKISDFGLARIFGGDQIFAKTKRVIGTYGYMSPEYAIDGRFSVKSDVFSFGVVLLEILSGKKNRGFYHPAHDHNLLGHAWLLWSEGKGLELMDACLEDSFEECQVLRCVQVGLLCVQKVPQDRPEMASVVLMLANEGIMLPPPKQPGFFIERSSESTSSETQSPSEKLHSCNLVTITMPVPR